MFTTEDLDRIKADYEEWLASQGKTPKKASGSRGAYNYVKKPPTARTVARRQLEKDIEEGVPSYLLIKDYDCGIKCKKCGSTQRYISSGTCSGCSKRLDMRTPEDIRNGVEALNARHQSTLNRKDAKWRKEKQYDGMPCKVCGTTQRYTASAGCVKCTKDKSIQRRKEENQQYHHETSNLMFVKGHRQLPEAYELCPALAAYPDYVLVFTDRVKPKRLVGTDAMLEPKLLSEYAHLYKEMTQRGKQPAEHEQIVVQYLTFEAMQLAWKLFNQRKVINHD